MGSAEMMCRALEAGDTSDAAVGAALDALREDDGLSYLDAVRRVARHVEAGLIAREIAAACDLIEEGSEWRERLLRHCRASAGVTAGEAHFVYVAAGNFAPRAYRETREAAGLLIGVWSITVGAKYLLAAVELMKGKPFPVPSEELPEVP
jgi:hypothetical protein